MTYIKDGSLYKYVTDKSIKNTSCYGWLTRSVSFYKPQKKQDFKVFQKLADAAFHHPTRGHHVCGLCNWRDSNYGNGEIWLKIEGKISVFPRMIWHYVESHDYGIPEKIYHSIILSKYEILTEQNVNDICHDESNFLADAPILIYRALWKLERYSSLGEFFNKNQSRWRFGKAYIENDFYVAELNSPPNDIEILFEDDAENFPDQIIVNLKTAQEK